ncbi:MAG: NAD(P)H-dependent oxidoreductase [Alphaproteobacteria bacterium]|nr:NAD(P)H-dependent oxidoreductase [Alphaproteobacteria bacterium]MBU2082575.1 NAD(P)H-dependent oxidoreductase [Alphaproteobacteria bacterium]MBU2142785.1 NAD(P)H-dependent oxidoreductase [Alphaproteobacteria bacterium]MBU2195207.1 NAD(P)H-dependent oxidoreductase [Alphaproteobacteria bacterium]
MQGRSYMLSVTLNAPQAAFADPAQALFAGRTLDDLLAPLHINFAFFGLKAHPTFPAHDVSKAPDAERHFATLRDHLNQLVLEAS